MQTVTTTILPTYLCIEDVMSMWWTRGGLRPQLDPDVVAQRGPKMPQNFMNGNREYTTHYWAPPIEVNGRPERNASLYFVKLYGRHSELSVSLLGPTQRTTNTRKQQLRIFNLLVKPTYLFYQTISSGCLCIHCSKKPKYSLFSLPSLWSQIIKVLFCWT